MHDRRSAPPRGGGPPASPPPRLCRCQAATQPGSASWRPRWSQPRRRPAPPPPVPPPCACKEQQYCQPLKTAPADQEVFPFVVGSNATDWYNFRWDLVTTAGWSIGANETVCYAHKQGARVVTASGW
eukprot:SAG22_NODE_1190_length_5206_cov_1.878990_4_plen_127_part_00